jgi:hypothetical protein
VAEGRVGGSPPGRVVHVAALRGGPLEDASAVVVTGHGGGAEVVQDHRVVVPRVGDGPDLAIAPCRGGGSEGSPGIPGPLLTQLVDDQEVHGQATASRPGGCGDTPPCTVREAQLLLAVGLPDAILGDLSGQGRRGLRSFDACLPGLTGDVEGLRGGQDQASAVDVHAPQGEGAEGVGLAVLAGHQAQDRLEAVRAVRVQLQGADEQLLLPGQQLLLEDVPGERGDLETLRRLRCQLPQWRRGDPRRTATRERYGAQ